MHYVVTDLLSLKESSFLLKYSTWKAIYVKKDMHLMLTTRKYRFNIAKLTLVFDKSDVNINIMA